MYRALVITVALLAITQSSLSDKPSSEIDGCSIASDVELGLIDSFKATSFSFNVAKNNELLRLKLQFKGPSPTIIIRYGSVQGLTFGRVNNVTTYGIYEKYSDFTANTPNPKITKSNVKLFSQNTFTEMNVILTKDGRFTVIAYDKFYSGTFDLTYKKGDSFINAEFLTVQFASNGKNGNTRFWVDCPWNIAGQ